MAGDTVYWAIAIGHINGIRSTDLIKVYRTSVIHLRPFSSSSSSCPSSGLSSFSGTGRAISLSLGRGSSKESV